MLVSVCVCDRVCVCVPCVGEVLLGVDIGGWTSPSTQKQAGIELRVLHLRWHEVDVATFFE